ncbi:fungal hydrophobin-domain-containing protein [Armillaria mellea]|nr:fungal hydrophobin-domain-containing protein [Armillaria mellea]
MFLRHSFTAILALPLLAHAGVIPIIPPVPSRDDSIGIAGRQVTTISPVIGPVLPIGSSIVSSRQLTGLPVISSILADLPGDESNDGAAITGGQLTGLPIISSILADLPRDESNDGAAITGRQVITGSSVISPVLPRGGTDGAACSATGTAQCCSSTESASDVSPGVATLFGLLGVVVSDLTANVGVTCSPISVIGVGGTSCSSQAVCCDNNNFNGLVALGCTPLNVGL